MRYLLIINQCYLYYEIIFLIIYKIMVQETQAYDIYPLVSGIVIILFITFSIFNNLS